jgi:hypothetical protein
VAIKTEEDRLVRLEAIIETSQTPLGVYRYLYATVVMRRYSNDGLAEHHRHRFHLRRTCAHPHAPWH